MSFQFGESCYSTALAAAQASAASQIGSIVQIGSASYVVDVASASESSITYKFQDVLSTASVTKVASYTPLPCGLLDTADGVELGWLVAAAWIATAVVLHMRKAAQS